MTDINYHPLYLGGSCSQLAELIDGQRLYSRGNEYKIQTMPFFADFPFTWRESLDIVLFNYQAQWPIQMLSVNDELDYNSFISLN